MRTSSTLSIAVALATVLVGCSKSDPLYCDPDTPCDDPDRPYCDLDGEFPASDGLGRTCIAQPDFAVSLARPDDQVRIGDELAVEVDVDRIDDFPSDIVVEATDLPAGATAEPLTIPGDAASGTLTIHGGAADPGAVAMVTIMATASPAAGPIQHTADLHLLVLGPAGSLDPTFGSNGFAGQPSAASMDDATLLMQIADGGFIVGGANTDNVTAVLVRFTADGALDEDFGTSGWAEVDFGGSQVDPQGNILVGAQRDDSIVAAQGSDSGDIVLVQVTSDAARDAAFGDGGIVTQQIAGGIYLLVQALATGPNGEVVVGMSAGVSGDSIYLVRFSAQGERDPTFAADGRLEIDRGNNHYVGPVHVFDDGSFLVSGSAVDGGGTRRSFSQRYSPNGTLDSTYGNDGELVLPPTWGIGDILVDPDGRWLVGGAIDGTPAFYRLSTTGEVDPTFGAEGSIAVPVPEGRSGSIRALLADDDDIVAVGTPDVLMTRVQGETIDTSFGDGGVAIVDIENLSAKRAVRQADGRIVVLSDNDSLPFVLARFFD